MKAVRLLQSDTLSPTAVFTPRTALRTVNMRQIARTVVLPRSDPDKGGLDVSFHQRSVLFGQLADFDTDSQVWSASTSILENYAPSCL